MSLTTTTFDVVLLTVNVTPGANPNSTGLTVTANLTTIGGAAAQMFFDDGTNGDDTAGDNIFSFQHQLPSNVTPGMKTLPVTITDAQMRVGSAAINMDSALEDYTAVRHVMIAHG